VLHGDLVFCMTGYRGYAVFALPIDASGDITNSEKIAWQRSDAGPYVSSPVLYGDLLYFTKSRDAVLSIVEAKSGKPLLEQDRIPGLKTLYSSPVAAAGKLYFTDRDGRTVVLKHGAKLEVLATNEVGEGVDASMAIAGRQLFLRGQKHLYCIQAP
jgi:outer membrane protein assembly factor BamB